MDKTKERENKICEYLKSDGYIPLKPAELFVMLDVPESDTKLFYEMLERLIADGRVVLSKKHNLMPGAEPIVGILMKKAKGKYIVKYDGGEMFISPKNLNGAYHKDKVIVKKVKNSWQENFAAGRVIEIIERASRSLVCIYIKKGKSSYAIPDDKKLDFEILISKEERAGAVSGQKVLVEIESFGGIIPKGKIIKILGNNGERETEILSILIQNDIPYEFNRKTIKDAKKINDSVLEHEIIGRNDFRHLLTVTIDGEDTKDFDDAITISKKNGNYILGVHIADVTHYVSEGNQIDREALERGNSVYLPDRVLPMLPLELSNGICSLIEGKDRLTVSCIMEIDENGDLVKSEICESVINIDKRFTYTKVKCILNENIDINDKFGNILQTMYELEKILECKRIERGALDFLTTESKVNIDPSGMISDIYAYERNVATKIIEEFMILCNETVAEHFFWRETPFVYRTHEAPDSEKIEALSIFLKGFGRNIRGRRNVELHPKSIQNVLNDVKNTKEERIVNKGILRTMKQAKYAPENRGHFGLALKYYCHFTSPIRRYADLQIHRIIKESLKDSISAKRENVLKKKTETVSAHVSRTERQAEIVEREVQKLLKAEYMSGKIGEVYSGIISYVAKHGIYVELENTVEGMISLFSLHDDYYVYDGDNMRFIGETTNRVYALGDSVNVKVKYVNITERIIDFIFV